MTNPYRWGDVPPTAVAELKSRRKSRPAAAVPPHLVVPASRIDIDALLATTGWISPAAQRSPPVGRLASMFSALRRLLSLHRDRRGRGASQ